MDSIPMVIQIKQAYRDIEAHPELQAMSVFLGQGDWEKLKADFRDKLGDAASSNIDDIRVVLPDRTIPCFEHKGADSGIFFLIEHQNETHRSTAPTGAHVLGGDEV
jgi:hypothetical protein